MLKMVNALKRIRISSPTSSLVLLPSSTASVLIVLLGSIACIALLSPSHVSADDEKGESIVNPMPNLAYKKIEITEPTNGSSFTADVAVHRGQAHINIKGYALYAPSRLVAPTQLPESRLSWYFDDHFIGTGLSRSLAVYAACESPLRHHIIRLTVAFPDNTKITTSVRITTGGAC
jgi:hypothetical protein